MTLFSKSQLGALYAILSGFLYGFLGYFGVRVLEAHFSIPNMLFWRFIISAFCLALILPFTKERVLKKRKEIIQVFFYGALFYSIAPMFFFVATPYIGTGLAMVIFFVFPAIVILLNWILYKTKITPICYLSMVTILMGLLLLVDTSTFKFDLLGIGVSLLAALCYASYIVASKKSSLSPLLSTFVVSLGCAFTCLIIALIDQSFLIPTQLDTWIYLFGFGIICTLMPILLFLEALKYINSEKASILGVLEPVFVVIIGVILLGEKINLLQSFGIVVILTGAFLELLIRHFKQRELTE